MGRLLGVLAIGLGGCGAPPPPLATSTTMALGGAAPDGAFAALTDGQDVTLVEGAQGGFHVWMKYRLQGATPGTVTLERTAHRLSDDAVILRTMGEVDIGAPDGSGWFESPTALPMFMCPSPIGLSVIDTPVVFELRFLDGAGRELTKHSVTLVAHCPDGQRDFCMRICTG